MRETFREGLTPSVESSHPRGAAVVSVCCHMGKAHPA